MPGTLVFDVETHSADLLFSMAPEEFIRLIGYRWVGDSEVTITTDLEDLRSQILSADMVIGHNIISFDLPAVFGHRSDIPMELADAGRLYDTFVHGVLANPAPPFYENRHGKGAKAEKPEQMMAWFGLDEQAFQLGVQGKTADLSELAMEFGDPELTGKDRKKDGFGKIPVDDPRFVAYLVGDVEASELVARKLLEKMPLNDYAMREQRIAARMAVISSNGFRVDIEVAQARVNELAKKREEILDWLVEKYDFPTEGKSPWASSAGEAAIMAALEDYGITPKTVDWPKTPSWEKRGEKRQEAKWKAAELEEKIAEWKQELEGDSLPKRSREARERWIERDTALAKKLRENPLPSSFGLSLGGKELQAITKGTEAEDLGNALAELKGQRSLAQLALDCTHPDGFVHPSITMLQRSGRGSTTEPGLTVWTARGEGAIEKAYFLPDNDDEVILEIDYSNADARAVAAMSGDRKYAVRFQPGQDGHMLNAIAAWGQDVVMESEETKASYRQRAKVPGHGWGYRIGPGKLSKSTGMEFQEAKMFLENMNKAYKGVVAWQDKSSKAAARDGFVVNHWGRKMVVEEGREYTQGPALLGQSVTREIVCDALLEMPYAVLRKIKAWIHDALAFSVPKEDFELWRDNLCQIMTATFSPPGGQRIEFPVTSGPPGANWYESGH